MMILANSSASVRAKCLGAPLDLGRSGTGCGMVFTGCEGRRIFSRPGTHIANGAGPRHYGLGAAHTRSPPAFWELEQKLARNFSSGLQLWAQCFASGAAPLIGA